MGNQIGRGDKWQRDVEGEYQPKYMHKNSVIGQRITKKHGIDSN